MRKKLSNGFYPCAKYRKIENGKWKMENGKWKMENGEHTMNDQPNSQLSTVNSPLIPPGYKLTEVGVIPGDWDIIKCKDLCEKIQDGTHFSPKLGGNDYLYITSKNIRYGNIDLKNIERIDTFQHKAIYKRCDVRYGDLLLTKDGANTGNATLNNLQEEFSLLSSVAFLRFDSKKNDAHYFLQQILSKQGQQQIKEAMSGNAITRLTLEKINKLTFPVPNLPEQRAIAAALSDVDELIAKLDQIIAKKRDIKQAAMQELLTGKTRLPMRMENGELKMDNAGNPVRFSGDWEVKRLGDLFAFSGGFTASRDQLSESGYCYLHYGDIHKSGKSYIDIDAEYINIPKLAIELNRINSSALLKDGDVVFVDASEDEEGTSKHIVVINPNNRPYISGLHTIVAKCKTDDLNNEFKRFCFQTRNIKEQFRFFAAGTKVSGISKTNIAKIELYFPSKPEQTAIAAVLSDTDAEIAAFEARREKTKLIKQGMMQELLTGRIRLIENGKLKREN